jgi:hypothetical protein
MNKELKLRKDAKKILKLIIDENGTLIDAEVDVNDDEHWKNILNRKNIVKIETSEWEWNCLTGQVILFQ